MYRVTRRIRVALRRIVVDYYGNIYGSATEKACKES